MFQFVGLATCIGWHASCVPGFPIRTSADQRPFAPPRGFSQPAASFIASGSQGIPRAPYGTCRVPRPSRRPRGHGTLEYPRSYFFLLELKVESWEWKAFPFPTFRFPLVCVSFLPSCQRTLSVSPRRGSRPASALPDRVESKGFEPLTPGLQSRCSGQLS